VQELADLLGVKALRAHRLLVELESTGLIYTTEDSFWLTDSGKKFVVDKGWV
jgi:DNA-binding IclR family transcriptional regulator